MQKNEKFFKKSMVLLIKDFIFAPANGKMLYITNDLVAQLVEHLPFKERVLGSSPSPVTKRLNKNLDNLLIIKVFYLWYFLQTHIDKIIFICL